MEALPSTSIQPASVGITVSKLIIVKVDCCDAYYISMLRYVVLAHDWPMPHFDLMLEHGGMLRTWRLTAWPLVEGQSVERLPDHRLAYLEYEGPVSGGRGVVKRVACGEYRLVSEDAELWVVELLGVGVMSLPRLP